MHITILLSYMIDRVSNSLEKGIKGNSWFSLPSTKKKDPSLGKPMPLMIMMEEGCYVWAVGR